MEEGAMGNGIGQDSELEAPECMVSPPSSLRPIGSLPVLWQHAACTSNPHGTAAPLLYERMESVAANLECMAALSVKSVILSPRTSHTATIVIMASFTNSFVVFSIISLLACSINAQLSPNFYASTCPNVQNIVRVEMVQAVIREPRLGASILRLFFHDCFVNVGFQCLAQGCDASILLDDTATFTGEKNALPNQNSVRGFEVIDTIKTRVEATCNATVSCADILALAARDGVVLLGGPSWTVPLGRRDARTANQSAANNDLPAPFANLSALISGFAAKGLNADDMTALSGSHTIGQAQCFTFRSRIYNDTNIDPNFAATRRSTCPVSGGDSNLGPLDIQTMNKFDNKYYENLEAQRGLFHSDQELFNGGSQDALVRAIVLIMPCFSEISLLLW
ncbi:Peroxidase 4 [Vitis vinifera]|uniref:Peroxidase n=1 Tax=Vitis vinifera TaxID=29760 RepID=A0A438CAI9_VITVI|nr:Peroxidase 4 [Vitis vinifera]